jgi:hypothetical protein
VSSPLAENQIYMSRGDNEPKFHDLTLYSSAIGGLLFLANGTRADILASVSIFSQFVSNSSQNHWKGVSHILKYLAGTKDYGIFYAKNLTGEVKFEAFSHSDHCGCTETRKSRSGCMMMLNNSFVSAFSRKQSGVTISTLEEEKLRFLGMS